MQQPPKTRLLTVQSLAMDKQETKKKDHPIKTGKDYKEDMFENVSI